MNREEAKQWAELFNALAEGKTIQIKHYIYFGESEETEWEDVDFDEIDCQRCLLDYRIKPTPKTRKMTNQELADWLRDCPHEHREIRWTNGIRVWCFCDYNETAANTPCDKVLIRRNHGKWEEPLIEVEE